jgi:hypothetical protein
LGVGERCGEQSCNEDGWQKKSGVFHSGSIFYARYAT